MATFSKISSSSFDHEITYFGSFISKINFTVNFIFILGPRDWIFGFCKHPELDFADKVRQENENEHLNGNRIKKYDIKDAISRSGDEIRFF